MSFLQSNFLVSIVVPWWDHSELLELWEGNLKYLKDTEIIFVDNGSQPSGETALKDFCDRHHIKIIRNAENRGFSAANNQGLAVATGEYILHLNNDIEILELPINDLCNLAGEGIAGPGLQRTELNNTYVEGWALCIKRSTLQALGGWCEDYGPGYWDDVDLCYRADLAGYPLTPVPELHQMIHHITNATGRDGRINQLDLHHRNRGIFLKKYYQSFPKIVIDGVFFQQSYKNGINTVWRSLLAEWAENGFAKYIVVLDRAETAPKIPGIRYRTIPPYKYNNTDADREMLQLLCDEEGADLFISNYYSTPTTTPSVFMAYDMIPEVLGQDLNIPMWREKHKGIEHASAYIAISQNTAQDLIKLFPQISKESVTVAYCGIPTSFAPSPLEAVNSFKTKYGISKPYFLLVGTGGHKNTILFFQAFAQLPTKQGFEIVCTGTTEVLDPEFRTYTSGNLVHVLNLDEEELKTAYSGAVALVYPSKYEGFGLPVLEALTCGCPVITCPNASIPEVAGEAVFYVRDDDVDQLTHALCDVQKPSVRESLI
ncbi:MAG: glycosyltransferase, partial [Crinalium sp.]